MKKDEEGRRARLERIKTIERWILVPILAISLIAYFSIARAEVVGESMEPTLHSGQRVTVLRQFRWLGPLKLGDIVVVEVGPQKLRDQQVVKRIVFIQNARGDAPWPTRLTVPRGTFATNELFTDPTRTPPNVPNGIYVLGDNLQNSTDSREFGPVLEREIYGKVLGVK